MLWGFGSGELGSLLRPFTRPPDRPETCESLWRTIKIIVKRSTVTQIYQNQKKTTKTPSPTRPSLCAARIARDYAELRPDRAPGFGRIQTNPKGSRSGFWPSTFLKPGVPGPKHPHIFRYILVFLKHKCFLALVHQATQKAALPNNNCEFRPAPPKAADPKNSPTVEPQLKNTKYLPKVSHATPKCTT